jgi:hypothetical protein
LVAERWAWAFGRWVAAHPNGAAFVTCSVPKRTAHAGQDFRPGLIGTPGGWSRRVVRCLVVALDFNELKEQSNPYLFGFLTTELDLGFTFAALAKYERKVGNAEHFQQCRRDVKTVIETVERFKERLSADAKLAIDTGAAELARLISAL